MTLQEAQTFFENLKAHSEHTSKSKIYDSWLHIILNLEKRTFSESDLELIRVELHKVLQKIDSDTSKRHLNKGLESFKTFLNKTFSLTVKEYYTRKGIALGMTFGMLFGIIFLPNMGRSLGLSLGLSIGMMIGYGLGRYLDQKAIKDSKTI